MSRTSTIIISVGMVLSIASSLAAPIPCDTRRIVTRGLCQSCMGEKDASNDRNDSLPIARTPFERLNAMNSPPRKQPNIPMVWRQVAAQHAMAEALRRSPDAQIEATKNALERLNAMNLPPRKQPNIPMVWRQVAAQHAMVEALRRSPELRRPARNPLPQKSLKAVATANTQIEAAKNDVHQEKLKTT